MCSTVIQTFAALKHTSYVLHPASEPCTDVDCYGSWPSPSIINSVGGILRVCNTTDDPILLKKYQHFGQVSPVYTPTLTCQLVYCLSYPLKLKLHFHYLVQSFPHMLHTISGRKYDEVFDPQFCGCNGAAGLFEACLNIGPAQPPHRNGRLPQYKESKLLELQQKCDDLEELGIFCKPEDIDIVAEYFNPSFLVKKPSGNFRLVTAFAKVGGHRKPRLALIPVRLPSGGT